MQMEGIKLAEENVKLRQELIELREQMQSRQEVHYQFNVYWRRTSEGENEGPYCPNCLDGDKKPARMTDRPEADFWRCAVCHCAISKPGTSLESGRAQRELDPLSD